MKFAHQLLIAFLLISSADRASSQWVETNGPQHSDFFAVMGSNLFAISDDGGISRSTDSGMSWSDDTMPWPTYQGAITMAVSDSNILVGTYGGGVYLSTDSGTTWNVSNTGLPNTIVYAFAVLGSNPSAMVIVGTDSGFFRSTDNGGTWSKISSPISSYLSTIVSSGTSLFVGSGIGVFRSTDSGISWTQVTSGLTNNNVTDLAVLGGSVFAGTYGGGIFRSTDNGTSWTPMNTSVTNTQISTLLASGMNLYAGTYYGAVGSCVFLSTDNGLTWVSANLSDVTVNAFAVLGSYLFAGTTYSDDAVWRIPLSDFFQSSVREITTDTSFAIYPNPASDKLYINSSMPEPIHLFDALGRSYSVPQNGNVLDVSSLPSGIYFVSDGVGGMKFVKE